MQGFFERELAPFFEPGAFDSVMASKRQMTFFLSYMARAATFWDSSPGLNRNTFELHQGSVLFEQVQSEFAVSLHADYTSDIFLMLWSVPDDHART